MGRVSSLALLPLVAMLAVFACADERTVPPPELSELAVRVADIGFAAAIPEPAADPVLPDTTVRTPPSPVGTLVRIGATGGDGVSLRSACRVDARIAGGWADGTELEVIEVGSGECEDWTRVEARGISSWVSNEYLPGLGEVQEVSAGDEEDAETAESEDAAAVRAWVGALDESSGRIALIARSATGASMPHQADFLRAIARDVGEVASTATTPSVGTFSEACGGAAVVLFGSAETLRIVAEQLAAFFDGWPATPYPAEVDRLVSQYAELASGAAPMVAECLAPGDS